MLRIPATVRRNIESWQFVIQVSPGPPADGLKQIRRNNEKGINTIFYFYFICFFAIYSERRWPRAQLGTNGNNRAQLGSLGGSKVGFGWAYGGSKVGKQWAKSGQRVGEEWAMLLLSFSAKSCT